MRRHNPPTILFAGGGSGGHIFPNLAVVERLREKGVAFEPLLLLSERSLDSQIARQNNVLSAALPVQPMRRSPRTWPGFYLAWRRSVALVRQIVQVRRVTAVVATGGFVSGPAVVAVRGQIPIVLINLDAVPGTANRRLARHCSSLFSAYDVTDWPHAQRVGLPLRRCARVENEPVSARQQLGLAPDTETLLVTGGSQGARSINQMMMTWVGREQVRDVLRRWQVIHLCGSVDQPELRKAYAQAGVPVQIWNFCDQMGLAWRASTIAISRAGAGSVAEAWANAVPCLLLPYPYHRDGHQRQNAEPVLEAGGCMTMRDLVDPVANATALDERLLPLLSNGTRRREMAERLRETYPGDGAETVAQWLVGQLNF